jgi:UDP-3-O-[3-hydroxymyristoyl] N-acetylglucosamine deacetylase
VEHVLAALYALGIDNVRLEIDGPEVPADDGSARGWAALIRRAGRKRLGRERKTGTLAAPVWQSAGDSWAMALPSKSALSLAVAVDYTDTVVRDQIIWLPEVARRFVVEIAPARTFALQHELEELRAAGLAKGGGVENAFTVGPQGYSGPLRFADEVVRHKALDLLGDLALCGRMLRAHVIAVRPGHRLNVEFAKAVRASLDSSMERTPS